MQLLLSKLLSYSILISHFLLTAQTSFSGVYCKPVNLKCEYLENPVGIDVINPRLTWHIQDSRFGAIQKAYRIYVSTDSLEITRGKANMWESGKVESSANLVVYNGKTLMPFTKYFWLVEVWDKDDKKTEPSQISSFETGMLDIKNWHGAWISDKNDMNTRPAPYFRTEFTASKKVKTARAYIAVAGLYELYINGEKIGNHRLDPVYTRFDRRTIYVTCDVTPQLISGKNAVGVLLGNGWYNHQSTAVWNFHNAPWRERPAFCMDLRIIYEDGTVETITTGKNWKTSLGPLVFNSIYTGEHYDARLEQAGWNTADFDDSKWSEVIYRAAPSRNIVSQLLHPIRDVEKIPALNVSKVNDTAYIFNFGRNIAGVSELKLKGKAGTIIRVKHGERLKRDGNIDMSNIDLHYRPTDDSDPFQTDIYILSGKGEETFKPKFNYKGFQYVEITSSKAVSLTKESLTAYFMHTDVPVSGNISTTDSILYKVWKATNNSYLSNLFGYPTDCPQREKNGWTGDAHIAVETGLYSFDGITVYEKWMADHRDEQQPNGVLPSIIPTCGWGYEWGNGPDWTSTIALIPWNIYLFYGDGKILAENYQNIKRYVDHIDELYPSGLTSWGLGDWVPVKSKSPVELTSSVYYFVDATILSKAARMLGYKEDFEKYAHLADKIKAAINDKYLNKETGLYGSGYQSELSIPLHWGVVPDELRQKVAENLAKRVEADNLHIDVGLLGTKSILNALSENGYADIAYKLASQETYPSWGWWIKNGATTLYENWDVNAKYDISLNHIMFGEIGAWMYKALGGIKPDPENPGFRNILIEPHFVEGLNYFKAEHESPYGMIFSEWKRVSGKIIYKVIIPPGSEASVRLFIPKKKKLFREGKQVKALSGPVYSDQIKAGTYTFEIK